MMFWMISFGLVVLAMAGLLLPLLRQPKALAEVERSGQNIQIAREQLVELERMNTAGELEQSEYQTRKQELESALLDDLQVDSAQPSTRKTLSPLLTAIAVGVFVPVAAFGLYAWLGTPQALQASAPQQGLPANHPPMTGNNPQAPDIGKMVASLRTKLDANPDNPDGWAMLGRSYMEMGRYDEAAQAFRKLLQLQPDNVDAMLTLADALAMNNGGKVGEDAAQLALKVLATAPDNVTALWLAGLGAMEKGDKASALQHWKKLLPLLADSPEEQAEVQSLIQQTESKAP